MTFGNMLSRTHIVMLVLASSIPAAAQYKIKWEDFSATETRLVGQCISTSIVTRNDPPFYFETICARNPDGSRTNCAQQTIFIQWLDGEQQQVICLALDEWQTQERKRLPDGDLIDLTIAENAVSPSIVEFVLEAAPNITWYKGITVPDGTGATFRIWTQDKRKSSTVSLWSTQVHNGQSLLFTKAGFLGFWRNSYLLAGLDRLKPGTRVTFRWIAD